MSKGIACGILLFYMVCTCMGRQEKVGLLKKGIHWLVKVGRKRGWIQSADWNCRRLETVWMLLLACSAGSLILTAAREYTAGESVAGIERPANGRGSVQEELEVHWRSDDDESGKETLFVEIEEKMLTEEELAKQFQEIKRKLPEVILGENESTESICHDLVLPSSLDGYTAAITWSTSDSEIIDWEGRLGSAVLPEGEQIILTAFLSLQGEEETCEISLTVFPEKKTIQQTIEEELQEKNKDRTDPWFSFPEKSGGRTLVWNRKDDSTTEGMCLLILLLPFLYLIWKQAEEKEKQRKEEQSLRRDYPEIVTKLTLLLGTGLNLHKAMERIAKDYQKQYDGNKRIAYEAIVKICLDMQTGISEKDAYEELGRLCRIPCYRTLSALLVQQLTKGSRGMNRMLEEEAQKAYEMRRQQAEILGEQASTKLLFPMILMLVIVFMILMVPAWLSFGF